MSHTILRVLVMVAAISGSIWLYLDGTEHGALPGIVDAPVCLARPLIGGRIASLSATLGGIVEANMPIAALDPGELVRELELLETRLATAEAALKDERQRLALARDERRLSLRGAVLSLQRATQEQRAVMMADQTEVSRLGEEIARLESALEAGLGRSTALSGLKRRRDVVARRLGGLRVALGMAQRQHQTASEALDAWIRADPEVAIRAQMAPRVDRVEAVRQEVLEVRQRLSDHQIKAPCSGRAVEVMIPVGAVVAAFDPIVRIEATESRAVDAWMPETTQQPAQIGDEVAIFAPFRGVEATGRVVFLAPGLSALPARLVPDSAPIWGRRVRIEVVDEHDLMPGERVDVRVQGGVP